ncbi:MAG: hypothetical protein II649_00500, partial [Kiritimatiellae bacterium]|nr:hypothetical protein [Kiritimatiellia bacterium]
MRKYGTLMPCGDGFDGNNINNFLSQLPFTRGLTRPRSFAKLGLGRDGARPSRTRLLAKFKARPKGKVVFESCLGCFKNKTPSGAS